jgi:cell filamentation protein, protein adenylyltransferase
MAGASLRVAVQLVDATSGAHLWAETYTRPARVEEAMSALERMFHQEDATYPVLVTAALAHVQFESIHPFLDGNGRIGRLLIPLLLHTAGLLQQPLLYLSLYFKQHRDE